MKTVQLCICFAFVAFVHCDIGYVGRTAKKSPALKRAAHFSPLGSAVADPKWVRDLIGKSAGDGPIIGGMGEFPRHGGAGPGERFRNGLRNGWGGDPALSMHPSVSAWEDPLDSLPFPTDYRGQELMLDPNARRWVFPKSGSIKGHKVPKKTGYGSRRTGLHGIKKPVKPILPVKPIKPIMPKPVMPVVPKPILPKKAGYPARRIMPKPIMPKHPIHSIKPIMPKPVRPKTPVMPKKPGMHQHGLAGVGGPGFLSGGPLGHGGIGSPFPTDLIGSTLNGQPIIGGIGDFPRHGGAGPGERFADGIRDGWGADHGVAQVQSVSTWQDPLGGRMFPHDYSGGDLVLDPTGQHYIRKQTVGAATRAIEHDIAKSTDVMGTHIGLSGVRSQIGPVHNVEKALSTGKVQAGHDMLAVGIGQDIARHAAANAEMTIDAGSGGALSMGNQLANAAAHGLAKESVHVAGKLLNKAGDMGRSGIPKAPVLPPMAGLPTGPLMPPMAPILPPVGGGGYGRTRTRRVRDW